MYNKLKAGVMIVAGTVLLTVAGCGGDLEQSPKGTLTEEQITNGGNIDGLVTATYAYLGNDHYTAPNFLWPTGNLRAGDAHKGGNGPGDIFAYHALSMYTSIIADMESYPPDFVDLNNKKWVRNYTAISRANTALKALANTTEAQFAKKTIREAELRFLRAFFYFDLKIHHKHIPYVDETMSSEQIKAQTNFDLTDQQLWDKIAADFQFAADNLPLTQSEIGRANQLSAKAYLAKTKLYQAYEQNDVHQVVNIDLEKLQTVVDLVDDIEDAGVYGLQDDFGQNFLHRFENSKESVFAIQRSRNDGSPDGRGSWPTALNAPLQGGFGCCGFHVPTENFVNAFKTDAQGLPQFDSFNSSNYVLAQDAVDPRLDHTVAMQGKPFKYDSELMIENGNAWARAPAVYGNFISMKELEHPDCECRIQNGPFPVFSMNTVLIRFADVLLWKAEALIELNRLDEALQIINRLRSRAMNSTAMLNNASIYNVGLYTAFTSQEQARRALRMERRLELGLEGHRFFDLVRWGVAKQTLDTYLEVERTRKPYLQEALFTAGRDEYLPIPQQQINLSGGLYKQLPGY
ncbi:Starch-binding associating with outer membrane [Rheinheimera pacifica]|uniref:Starch-binding associating with outer membrane n=1 Tax=Rheinheimera pacifica TaxID=173990 RepID=A0A1H6K6E4_9GAMM|nr:RagB/SusD family nutrient uptake outer membrane protein [Rheinheimera pacifica]SEH67376.1 Starch-binding associating with outer membrane [Rheinheimera pacifica]